MKIVVTGGGSGGHITPILAVAHELKRLKPTVEIIYIGQKGDQLSDIPEQDPAIDQAYAIWAGKFRRYSNEGWKQLLDVRTQFLNIRDGFRVLYGTWQSFWLLRRLQPDAIFTRGGFVSVPVALGGKLNGVPYLTHDSDTVPSLANRLIARWAAVHAVGMPAALYPYPAAKTVQVGIPVSKHYKPVTTALQAQYRQALQLGNYKQVVLLTGGGNGSRPLNQALVANVRYLLQTFPDVAVVHLTGRILETETAQAYDALSLGKERERVITKGFTTDLYKYSGAADVVISRAGATTIAELALQQKACIIVPAPQLAGGHQLKNSRDLAAQQAIVQLTEEQMEQPERLGRTVGALLEDNVRRVQLGQKLATYARPHAAAELASLVLDVASGEEYAVQKK